MGSPATSVGQLGHEADLERSIGHALLHMIDLSRHDPERAGNVEHWAQLMADEGAHLLPGIQCRITGLPADRPGMVRVMAVSNGPAGMRLSEWPISASPTGWAIAAGAAVERTVDPTDLPALRDLVDGARTTTVRVVPLSGAGTAVAGGPLLGALVVLRRGGAPFTAAERAIIDTYSTLVSLLLARSELQAEAARQTRRLEIGVQVALDLALSLEPADVVRRLLQRATEAVAADRAALTRVEGPLAITEGRHDLDGLGLGEGRQASWLDQPLARRALETRRPVLGGAVELATLPPDLRRAYRDVRHTALLPLLHAGEVVGLLIVNRRRDVPFTDHDVLTLQIIGNVAVLALRNARLYEDAQIATERMSSFVDLVVHELRSPLTVIAGYIDILQRGVPRGDSLWSKPLQMVAAKIGEMQALVDELVLSARLSNGPLATAATEVDLVAAVRSALGRAEARSQLIQAELAADLPPCPVLVMADPANVDHILDNLLNNALSYAGPHPRICVEVTVDPPAVNVSDSGPGIRPELRERVFERFFRVNPAAGQPGSGLGLSISRQLAARCGGTLDLEPGELGRGCRFRLRLPRAPLRQGPPSG